MGKGSLEALQGVYMGPRMGFYKVENLYRPDNKLASGLVKVVR